MISSCYLRRCSTKPSRAHRRRHLKLPASLQQELMSPLASEYTADAEFVVKHWPAPQPSVASTWVQRQQEAVAVAEAIAAISSRRAYRDRDWHHWHDDETASSGFSQPSLEMTELAQLDTVCDVSLLAPVSSPGTTRARTRTVRTTRKQTRKSAAASQDGSSVSTSLMPPSVPVTVTVPDSMCVACNAPMPATATFCSDCGARK